MRNIVEEYNIWKNKPVNRKDVIGSIEMLADDISIKEFFLERVKELLTARDPETMLLKEVLILSYRRLPESHFLRRRGIKNIAREAIVMTVFREYPELNWKHVTDCLERKIKNTTREKRNVAPSIESYLLEKISFIIVDIFKEVEETKKIIGLDESRVRMAMFWNFDTKYKIIDDTEAITIAEKKQVNYIDVRYGTIHKVNKAEDVDKLLDMKEWFVFGLAI